MARRKQAKSRLLQMHYESRVGHIGGNLSSLDLLLTLFHDVLTPNDQFILSKGHAAGALYVTLWSVGRLSDDDLRQFHKDNTLLSGHPPANGISEILFATGSLGHGLGLACGLALGKQLRGEAGRIFCLTSDGEWNEGSCWESLIFAAHRQLKNLVFLVDNNGLQGFGRTSEVAHLDPLVERFQAFNVTAKEIPGHDASAISSAIAEPSERFPLVLVAKTVKGSGISFMENCLDWHYLPMTEQQYTLALSESSKP